MASFKLRETAENDLLSIGIESRERWGDAQMRRYLKSLDDDFHALAAMPAMGEGVQPYQARLSTA